jgi:hypothetical protein
VFEGFEIVVTKENKSYKVCKIPFYLKLIVYLCSPSWHGLSILTFSLDEDLYCNT